jgi:hypothetical protein
LVRQIERVVGLIGPDPEQREKAGEARKRKEEGGGKGISRLQPGDGLHLIGVPREERGAVEQNEVLSSLLSPFVGEQPVALDTQKLDGQSAAIGYRVRLCIGVAVGETNPRVVCLAGGSEYALRER